MEQNQSETIMDTRSMDILPTEDIISSSPPACAFSLPIEILEKVFLHCDTTVLLDISTDPQLKWFTFSRNVLSRLDFSNPTIGVTWKRVKDFLVSKTRRRYIKELNCSHFGNLGFQLTTLFKLTWSNLKILNISHCDVLEQEIFSIGKQLQQLEEILYSTFLSERECTHSLLLDSPTLFNWRKLTLDCVCSKSHFYSISKHLTRLACPHLKELTMNMYHLPGSASRPFNFSHRGQMKSFKFEHFSSLEKVYLSSDHEPDTDCILPDIIKKIPENRSNMSLLLLPTTPQWDALPSLRNLSTTTGYSSARFSIAEIDSIKSAVGSDIRNLSLLGFYNAAPELRAFNEINDPEPCFGYLDISHYAVCSNFSEFVTTSGIFQQCPNIEQLNLFRTQVTHEKIYSELKNLTRLKALLIMDHSSRASSPSSETSENTVKKKRIAHNSRNPEIRRSLQKIIYHCPLLEEIDIRGKQMHDPVEPYFEDKDYEYISNLKGLKRLTLVRTKGVHLGQFLVSVSLKCQTLKSLRLHDIGNNVCSHWAFLLEALPSMQNLEELSLHHSDLRIHKQDLWMAMGKIPKLRELCLKTGTSSSIDVRYIELFLSEAKTLQVFHIHGNLRNYGQIERCITRHTCGRRLIEHYVQKGREVLTEMQKGLFRYKFKLCFAGSRIGTGLP